jgi:hypothetical protein
MSPAYASEDEDGEGEPDGYVDRGDAVPSQFLISHTSHGKNHFTPSLSTLIV